MELKTITMRLLIGTTAGGDSKYMFPGNFRHSTVEASVDGPYGTYDWVRLNSHGQPMKGPLTHFHLLSAGDIQSTGVDLYGNVEIWAVADNRHPSDAYGTVEFVDEDGVAVGVPIQTFNHATANQILFDASQVADITFELIGNKGNDTLRGSNYGDTFDGRHGKDLMIGGKGNDFYYVDNAGDRVRDSAGKHDAVSSSISYRLGGSIENLYGDGIKNINLTGNSHNNWVTGTNGRNVLKGLDGNDKLMGYLSHDTLTGGAGKDQFYFNEARSNFDADTITDFKRGTDKIWLFASGFDVGFTFTQWHEHLMPDVFHASKNGHAQDAEDRILYATRTGKLYYDEDGTGSGERILLATFDHHPSLHGRDFMVYIA